MPPNEAAAEAARPDTIALTLLKFISSLGHYGMFVGPAMAAYGISKWDKTLITVGVVGGILSFGWMTFWDWVITKVAART